MNVVPLATLLDEAALETLRTIVYVALVGAVVWVVYR